MALTAEASALYQHLRLDVIPSRRVATYGAVSAATGVPIGVDGGHIGKVLGEIASACDLHKLPPLTAIVVRADEQYDSTGHHGMPGSGYFVQEAQSPNSAQRQGHDLFLRWAMHPSPAGFDKDADRWELRAQVEAHQDSVWRHRRWPESL